MNAVRLHLGCGKVVIPGYINADIQCAPGVELVCDARGLPFPDDSLTLIYACALIGHLSRWEWWKAAKEWHRALRPGGIVRISTDDFRAICEQYLETRSLEGLYGLLVGGQRDAYDWHGMMFDFNSLRHGLESVGFRNVMPYDWRNTIVGELEIDDYSQAYLPHMDREFGRLMALNVEATA